jgi:hypothetical protein
MFSTISSKQIDLIAHSIGINIRYALNSFRLKDKTLPEEFNRNYFCAGKSLHTDFEFLVSKGLVKKRKQFDGQIFYFVTNLGQTEFRKYFTRIVTDLYVPLTKSKATYQDYLYSDGCDSFTDYLGIWLPKFEKSGGYFSKNTDLIRMVSTNPNYLKTINGEYCKTQKAAKISYKLALKNERKKIRTNGINSI